MDGKGQHATRSPPTELNKDQIGSPASSSAGIAKQAGDQHTGQTFDISQDPAASIYEEYDVTPRSFR